MRFRRISVYVIPFVIFLLIVFVISLLLIRKFPFQVVTDDFDSALHTAFTLPWPTAPLEKELRERKRLKRYAKSEQERRMKLQNEKMKYINSVIADFFENPDTEIFTTRGENLPDFTAFPWPLFFHARSFLNSADKFSKRSSYFMFFPETNGTRLLEGVFLTGNEEIRTPVPITKLKRRLNFTIFPITTGSIRVVLGQNIWAKTITDEDIYKENEILIPINDMAATNVKIGSISCSFYLMDAYVSQLEDNARAPIQVSVNSALWTVSKNSLPPVPSPDFAIEPSDKGDEEKSDDTLIPPPLTDDLLQTAPPPPPAITPPTPVKEKGKVAVPDPLEQRKNMQMSSVQKYSVALGYNLLYLHLNEIPWEVLNNPALLSSLAPNLAELFNESAKFHNVEAYKNSFENFRQVILAKDFRDFSQDHQLINYLIGANKDLNLYYQFKRFGYNVMTLTSPEALYFDKEISHGIDFASIKGKWLEPRDWQLLKRNKELDDKGAPVTGLDAIFKTKNAEISEPVTDQNLAKINNFIFAISNKEASMPNWMPDEYLFVDKRDFYIAKVLDAFDDWTMENQQKRFFAHVSFDAQEDYIRTTFKDFLGALKTLKIKALFRPRSLYAYSKIILLDRALGQLLGTLRARKIENRTIIVLLIPQEKMLLSQEKQRSSALIKIPGLQPRSRDENERTSFLDILATSVTSLGIPLGKNVDKSIISFPGNSLELKKNAGALRQNPQGDALEKKILLKYSLIIQPRKTNCAPFSWQAFNSELFALNSSEPILEVEKDGSAVTFYTCAIQKNNVLVSWYQRIAPTAAFSDFKSYLGGHFAIAKGTENRDLPIFFFGPKMLSLDNPVFSFAEYSLPQLNAIFKTNAANFSQMQREMMESMSIMSQSNAYQNNSSMASLLVTQIDDANL